MSDGMRGSGEAFGSMPAVAARTRERVPLDWAKTQNNLGAALKRLGERESGTARLEEAVAVYRAALEERTRDRVPLRWAMTENNPFRQGRLSEIGLLCAAAEQHGDREISEELGSTDPISPAHFPAP